MLSAGVDGFVVYAAADDDPYLQLVLQRQLPVVVVDQPADVPGASRVGIDDRAAMREWPTTSSGLGHREIGLLTMRLGSERATGGATASIADRPRAAPRTSTCSANASRRARRDGRCGAEPESLTVVESYEHIPTSGGAAAEVALARQPADHRVDVHRRRAGPLGDGLSAGARYLRTGQMTVTGFDGIPEALKRGLTTVAAESERAAAQDPAQPVVAGLPVSNCRTEPLVALRTARGRGARRPKGWAGRTSGPPA